MGEASVSFEKISTRPNMTKLVARVVTNDGTFNITVIRPLTSPTPTTTRAR